MRIATRMFPAENEEEWEPFKVREKQRTKPRESNGTADISLNDPDGQDVSVVDDDIIYEEDPTSEDGAVYPIREGRVVNWSCFFALLTHIHKTFDPPFHHPILLVAQPAWTAQDHEYLTQFFFEKFKIPAFCIMDAALAVCYAYAVPTATIIDVGYTKCDVTAVRDFMISEVGRGVALPDCGGEAMTQRLLNVLSSKGFTREMCEQLKKNIICEILPPGTDLPREDQVADAPQKSTSIVTTGLPATGDAIVENTSPIQPDAGTAGTTGEVRDEEDQQDGDDNEGILDVASIVASGKTSEFLAQKEREKAAKAAARKNAAAEAAAISRQARLPNSKRAKAAFHYHERKPIDELGGDKSSGLNGDTALNPVIRGPEADKPVENGASEEAVAAARKEERREERRRNREGTAYVRKEAEVGPERFEAASDGLLERIADSIHRCILSVPETSKRSELWESLVILGNGSRVKGMPIRYTFIASCLLLTGFKEALLATLNAKYLISPSSATIFSSELPSNFTTPVATGANTPQRQPPQPTHHGQGVNPLLLAATTASNAGLAPPGQQQQLHTQLQLQQQQQQMMQQTSSHSHSQTPTSIKFLKSPDYFPEWKDVGMEEASFLGAQVAAKVVFVVDQGLSKGYMSRTEYNDLGPQGIHESAM